MKINLIMPMGGAGTRFANNGFECPKPLLPLEGRPFFAWAADSIRGHVELESITFVVLKEHIERFGIDREILKYAPDAEICVLDHVLNGAVLTCMEGAKSVKNDAPIIFCDCDLTFTCDALYEYYKRDAHSADGTLVTFNSDLPRYSYVRKDESGLVVETAEKKVISHEAICGAYGFGNKDIFLKAADKYMDTCTYSEYFMSGVYNLIIGQGGKVMNFPTDRMISFGTPDEYEKARSLIHAYTD